jgi:hypothetical protein
MFGIETANVSAPSKNAGGSAIGLSATDAYGRSLGQCDGTSSSPVWFKVNLDSGVCSPVHGGEPELRSWGHPVH